jgi:hypothetical protein
VCVAADGHFLLAFARIQSSRILLTRLEIVRLSAFASLVRAAFTAALIRAVNTTGAASFALGICIVLPCVTCFLTKIDANGPLHRQLLRGRTGGPAATAIKIVWSLNS